MIENILRCYITSNENIKCFTCKTNCPKRDKEYYLDIELFKTFIENNKNDLFNIKEFHLIGEPLLHKELFTICKIIKNNFTNSKIQIYTNGILLRAYSDYQLFNLSQNYSVSFYLTGINDFLYLNTYKEQIFRLLNLNIKINWELCNLIIDNYKYLYNDKILNYKEFINEIKENSFNQFNIKFLINEYKKLEFLKQDQFIFQKIIPYIKRHE